MNNKEINEFLKNASIENINIGCSNAKVTKIIKNDGTYYLKEAKRGTLDKEYLALNWLNGKIIVPEVVYFCSDNNNSFLITKQLDGEMLCCDELWDSPEKVIKLAAEAIKILQNVDYRTCPLSNDISHKLATAKYNIDNNLLKKNYCSDLYKQYGSYENIYNYLINNIPKEELSFSHGDTSLPNIFQKQGKISGYLDVGECGCADKWFDIAITVKSIIRNFEDERYVDMFFSYLGITPNNEKLNYYILLMELYL